MAESATLARPYARAAFEHARDAKALPAWSSLLSAGAAMVDDERFAALIGNPHLSSGELARAILDVAGKAAGSAPADTGTDAANFVNLLAQNGRLALLPEIAAQYEQLRAGVENTVDVEIVSALPLTTEQEKMFVDALTKRFKRTVRLTASVDPALIGGALVRSGDFVLDGSLRDRLTRLAQTMTN